MWNRAQQSRLCAVEINSLRGPHGMTRWEDESKGICMKDVPWKLVQMDFGGVVEWVKINMYIERIKRRACELKSINELKVLVGEEGSTCTKESLL